MEFIRAKSAAVGFLMALSTSTALAQFRPFEGDATWTRAQELPQFNQWSQMYGDAQEIANDLNYGGGKYRLEYKKPGGSSHQTLVIRNADRHVMGIWSAPNHATYIEGEIFAFHIARLFERSGYVTPGTRMTLTGTGLQQARIAYSQPGTPKARACNQEHILSYMNANPYYMTGVYKAFVDGTKPTDIPEIVDRKDQKRLDPNHFAVAMTSRDGNQPRNLPVYLHSNKQVSYVRARGQSVLATSTDTELAKQISFLSLIDAMNSQRDRFGPFGSNLESMLDLRNKTFTVAAVDNGGIADTAKTQSLQYFLKYTSRFEREVLERVLQLDDFLKGRQSGFLQFRSEAELRAAMGVELELSQDGHFIGPQTSGVCRDRYPQIYEAYGKRMALRWKNFVSSVDLIARKMRGLQYDQNAYF